MRKRDKNLKSPYLMKNSFTFKKGVLDSPIELPIELGGWGSKKAKKGPKALCREVMS